MATKSNEPTGSKLRLIVLGAVLVLAGAFGAWRYVNASGDTKVDAAAEANERALQEQIEREGLTAVPPPEEGEVEEPVKTKAARQVEGSGGG